MKIIVDTREQRPFTFTGKRYDGVMTEAGSLVTGDYSLAGLTDRVAIERKELLDLVACLGRERERFERELMRAAGLDCFAVVIEGTWHELAHGEYRSQLNPHSACQSIAALRQGTGSLSSNSSAWIPLLSSRGGNAASLHFSVFKRIFPI